MTNTFENLLELVEDFSGKKLVFVYNPEDYLRYSFWLMDKNYKMGKIDKCEIDPCMFAHTLEGGLKSMIKRLKEEKGKM